MLAHFVSGSECLCRHRPACLRVLPFFQVRLEQFYSLWLLYHQCHPVRKAVFCHGKWLDLVDPWAEGVVTLGSVDHACRTLESSDRCLTLASGCIILGDSACRLLPPCLSFLSNNPKRTVWGVERKAFFGGEISSFWFHIFLWVLTHLV
jgi:hypothetical protein